MNLKLYRFKTDLNVFYHIYTEMGFILLILLLVISINCTSQDKNLYRFDPRNHTGEEVTLSEIAEDIIYIPLDNSYPIGIIYNIKVINDQVFISAKDLGILQFTMAGKLIKKIGTIGRGPGEYTTFMSFGVNPQNETVYVKDRGNVIKVYSKGGNFIRSIFLNQKDSDVELLDVFNDKLLIFNYLQTGRAEDNWIVLDTLGNHFKSKKRSIPYFLSNYSSRSGVYNFQNNIFYWNSYNDTVFSISPDFTAKASFLLSPGIHRLPLSNFDPRDQSPVRLHLYYIFETNRFIILRYNYQETFIALVDKRNEISSKFVLEHGNNGGVDYSGGIFNDLDGGISFQPQYYFESKREEFIFGLVNSLLIKQHVGSKQFKYSDPKYSEKKKNLERLANSLKETDNPVLVLVRLKK